MVDAVGQRLICHRALTGNEQAVAYGEIGAAFDAADVSVEAAVRPVLERAALKVSREVKRIAVGSAPADERLEQIRALAISDTDRRKVEAALEAALVETADIAASSAQREVKRQASRKVAPSTGTGTRAAVPLADVPLQDVAAVTKVAAASAADEMIAETEAALRGAGRRAVLTSSARPLRDADEVVTGKKPGWFRKHAASPIGNVVAAARERAAIETLDALSFQAVEFALYSSLLDGNTCGPCRAADGTEVVVGSLEYQRLSPPYAECEGRVRDYCRCIWVYLGSRTLDEGPQAQGPGF